MIHTLEPIIREHPFFKDLAEPHLKLVVGCAKNVRFDEGQMLFREGEPADEFYMIRTGQVTIEVHVRDADRPFGRRLAKAMCSAGRGCFRRIAGILMRERNNQRAPWRSTANACGVNAIRTTTWVTN